MAMGRAQSLGFGIATKPKLQPLTLVALEAIQRVGGGGFLVCLRPPRRGGSSTHATIACRCDGQPQHALW